MPVCHQLLELVDTVVDFLAVAVADLVESYEQLIVDTRAPILEHKKQQKAEKQAHWDGKLVQVPYCILVGGCELIEVVASLGWEHPQHEFSLVQF